MALGPARQQDAPVPQAAGAKPAATKAERFEDKLWGGFSHQALQDLEAIKQSPDSTEAAATSAAWALASWYAAEGDFERAHDNAFYAARQDYTQSQMLLQAFCLVRLGKQEAARDVLRRALRKKPNSANLALAMASSYATTGQGLSQDDEQLAWINQPIVRAGLWPLAKRDPSLPLTIRNLAALAPADTADTAPAADQPKVSVIVPVYNAQDTLRFALDGLLAQTWRNIELIVVDDFSTDATPAVIDEYVKKDARVIALKQPQNLGSYAARNAGLIVANGQFITVHDANDWSHPQKIEMQVSHLLAHKNFVANFSNWARVSESLVFLGKFRRKDKLIDWNPSSLLFRRGLLKKVGGWDPVRISADAEFLRRAVKLNTGRKIGLCGIDAPLSFALDNLESLTKHGPTHGRTIYYGVRREYREAADYWLKNRVGRKLRIRIKDGVVRPFPVPALMLPERGAAAECDVLVIADFGKRSAAYALAIEQVDAAARRGESVAIFHWRDYNLDVTETLRNELRRRAQKQELRIVAPGETVRAKRVIVAEPAVMQYSIDLCPKVEFEDLVVIESAGGQTPEAAAAFDREKVRANLLAHFGAAGRWVAEPAAAAATTGPV